MSTYSKDDVLVGLTAGPATAGRVTERIDAARRMEMQREIEQTLNALVHEGLVSMERGAYKLTCEPTDDDARETGAALGTVMLATAHPAHIADTVERKSP